MLTTCSEPGCATLVMGGRCLEHDTRATRVFVRGRPFAGAPHIVVGSGVGIATFAASGVASTLDASRGGHVRFEPSRN
jgi:hypothetical protein